MTKFSHKISKSHLKQQLQYLYWHDDMSLDDISKIFGCSRRAIHKHMKKLGIKLRSLSEARLLALKKGKFKDFDYYYINEKFFKSWSKKMAYILGLIVTDGCISKNLNSVKLDMNEKELLEKVKSALKTNMPVRASKHQTGLFTLQISRQEIVKDLLNLGLTPRKSLTIKFPNVPEEYLPHFIRGVFDGDGSIVIKRYPGSSKKESAFGLAAHFESASSSFITTSERKLRLLGMPPRKIQVRKGTNVPYYKISYGHKDCRVLFNVMYRNIENGLFLERKYNVFQEGLAHRTKSERHECSENAPVALLRFFQLHKANPNKYTVKDLAEYMGCTRGTVYRLAKTEVKKVKSKWIRLIRDYLEQKFEGM